MLLLLICVTIPDLYYKSLISAHLRVLYPHLMIMVLSNVLIPFRLDLSQPYAAKTSSTFFTETQRSLEGGNWIHCAGWKYSLAYRPKLCLAILSWPPICPTTTVQMKRKAALSFACRGGYGSCQLSTLACDCTWFSAAMLLVIYLDVNPAFSWLQSLIEARDVSCMPQLISPAALPVLILDC